MNDVSISPAWSSGCSKMPLASSLASTVYQLQRNRWPSILSASSRSSGFISLPPWLLSSTIFRTPLLNARLHDVGNEAKQRRRIDVHRQRKAAHVRLGAVGNRRQQHDLRPAAVRLFANLLADDRALVHVGAIRQMQIVRLRRPQRQHGDFVRVVFGVGVVGFGENVVTHSIADCKLKIADL